MEQSTRPGGLTTLAILNFIWAFFRLFQILGGAFLVVGLVMIGNLGENEAPPEMFQPLVQMLDQLERVGMTREILLAQTGGTLALDIIAAPLLLLAGIGYLKQKRFLGYWVGNLYGVLISTGTIILLFYLHGLDSRAVRLELFIAFVYPLLTLGVLNTTFRRDFS